MKNPIFILICMAIALTGCRSIETNDYAVADRSLSNEIDHIDTRTNSSYKYFYFVLDERILDFDNITFFIENSNRDIIQQLEPEGESYVAIPAETKDFYLTWDKTDLNVAVLRRDGGLIWANESWTNEYLSFGTGQFADNGIYDIKFPYILWKNIYIQIQNKLYESGVHSWVYLRVYPEINEDGHWDESISDTESIEYTVPEGITYLNFTAMNFNGCIALYESRSQEMIAYGKYGTVSIEATELKDGSTYIIKHEDI